MEEYIDSIIRVGKILRKHNGRVRTLVYRKGYCQGLWERFP